ncbi:protein ZNRD2 isoform X2 [Neopsephotus bourkii]|uniref:protein ZNRD2 isoform X2 n=1 Tax=Neopsephotus bourkii TaxID=309878 RepID=UPI002AA50D4A|nr:protein ZNRD2 isoform X2 [Neopsephotus bourkii]
MALNAGAEPAPAAAELEARRERQEWTILLQDKDQKLHCVSCQDRDFDGSPAPEPTTASSPPPQRHAAPPRPEHCEGAATGLRGAPPPGPPEAAAVALARAAVLDKLGWAARELPRTASTEGSAQLCALVRACAEALGGLQALAPPGSPP